MSTKIDLELPFKNDWRLGYIVTNREDRKMVILFNDQKNRSTISYARYLMSLKVGRYLTEDEHVDHIDDDPTNDDIANLQILDHVENKKKYYKNIHGGQLFVELECPYCKTMFSIKKANSFLDQKNKINNYCTRPCMYKARKDPLFDADEPQTKLIREYRRHDK